MRGEGKERRYPLRAVYKDAANPHPRSRRAAGEVDMFISLRNLLGLRYQEAREREREIEREKEGAGGGEKWREMNRRRNSRPSGRSSGTGG